MTDTYQTIQSRALGEYKEKGSKFIAYAQAVYQEKDCKAFLDDIKQLHPKARHHCYAYRLGLDKSKDYRANDDGEPSGTAGRPILGQIDSKELSNAMVIVIRYFGGTKLGASGLIRAYKTATQEALTEATIIQEQLETVYHVYFNYIEMNKVMKFLKREKIIVLERDFGANCLVTIKVAQSKGERVVNLLEKISGVKVMSD